MIFTDFDVFSVRSWVLVYVTKCLMKLTPSWSMLRCRPDAREESVETLAQPFRSKSICFGSCKAPSFGSRLPSWLPVRLSKCKRSGNCSHLTQIFENSFSNFIFATDTNFSSKLVERLCRKTTLIS